jgi:hypothetical protein
MGPGGVFEAKDVCNDRRPSFPDARDWTEVDGGKQWKVNARGLGGVVLCYESTGAKEKSTHES